MSIQVGDTLPDASFGVVTPDGVESRSTADVFAGRTVVLFAVPGAFTPTCHKNHMAGYVANAAAIKAKGVDAIAVTGVNDPFVMEAWAKASGGAGTIEFLADGSAHFARAVGMDLDLAERGLGIRSKRYAMLVKDRVVQTLAVEETPTRADLSGAVAMLTSLDDLAGQG